jgi:release factor glutamine methyltransferase
VTLAEALAQGFARLQGAGIDGPGRDARLLLAHAAGLPADRLTMHLADELPAPALATFETLLDQRATRKPISQIIGRREFWGRDFIVTPDVLDPRPETEHLIEAALQAPFANVLDLGTGSGMILATLLAERPEAQGLGVDISDKALQVARQNLDRYAKRGTLAQSDWFAAITDQFDLIVSNPPYIAQAEMALLEPELAFEPQGALTDHADGLTAYRVIAKEATRHLAPNGRIIVEFGATQGPAVRAIFVAAGWNMADIRKDYAGHDRILVVSH